jgi:hypothetical protein
VTEQRYVTACFDRLFAVRWIGFKVPYLDDVREQISEMYARVRRPLLYLSLIPGANRAFSEQERLLLGNYVKSLLSECESIHHVIAGEGFVASARRSIVTQLALSSSRPDVFFTHATVEEAAAVLAPRLRMSSLALLEEARKHDLFFPIQADPRAV